MDDGSGIAKKSLVVLTGILVLTGAGCASTSVNPQSATLTPVTTNTPEVKNQTSEYVKGVREVCFEGGDIKSAEQMFQWSEFKVYNDQPLHDALRVPISEGWGVGKVCGERTAFPLVSDAIIYFTLDKGNQHRIGFWKIGEPKVALSAPFQTFSIELFYLKTTQVSPQENSYKVIATFDDNSIEKAHKGTYEFDPATQKITARECNSNVTCKNFY